MYIDAMLQESAQQAENMALELVAPVRMTKQRVEQLGGFGDLDEARTRSWIRQNGGPTGQSGAFRALAELEAAVATVEAAIQEAADAEQSAREQLQRLEEDAHPLPGSQGWHQLAVRVTELEQRAELAATIGFRLRDAFAHVVPGLGPELTRRAEAGRRRLLEVAVSLHAEGVVTEIAEELRQGRRMIRSALSRIHAVREYQAAVESVVGPVEVPQLTVDDIDALKAVAGSDAEPVLRQSGEEAAA